MNLYEAIAVENKHLARTARKLADSSRSPPGVRDDLLRQLAAHFEAQEAIRENHVYPILRAGADRQDILEQYRTRTEGLRDLVQTLRSLPEADEEEFRRSAEILCDGVESMTRWEVREVVPVVRDVLTDDEADGLGDWVRAEQKAVLREEL